MLGSDNVTLIFIMIFSVILFYSNLMLFNLDSIFYQKMITIRSMYIGISVSVAETNNEWSVFNQKHLKFWTFYNSSIILESVWANFIHNNMKYNFQIQIVRFAEFGSRVAYLSTLF